MNQVTELLGAIPLLLVRLQTRGGVVACSTTFKGRSCLCSAQSDVSKSIPRYFWREANKMADHINSLSSINPSIHNYINASTVLLPQITYYINRHTYLPTYRHIYHWKWDMKPYNKMSKRKQYRGCCRHPLKTIHIRSGSN